MAGVEKDVTVFFLFFLRARFATRGRIHTHGEKEREIKREREKGRKKKEAKGKYFRTVVQIFLVGFIIVFSVIFMFCWYFGCVP